MACLRRLTSRRHQLHARPRSRLRVPCRGRVAEPKRRGRFSVRRGPWGRRGGHGAPAPAAADRQLGHDPPRRGTRLRCARAPALSSGISACEGCVSAAIEPEVDHDETHLLSSHCPPRPTARALMHALVRTGSLSFWKRLRRAASGGRVIHCSTYTTARTHLPLTRSALFGVSHRQFGARPGAGLVGPGNAARVRFENAGSGPYCGLGKEVGSDLRSSGQT